MGASNSLPQTVRIENPKIIVPIEITPSVVTRLESAQSQQKESIEVTDPKESPRANDKEDSQETKVFNNPENPTKSHNTHKFYRKKQEWIENQPEDFRNKCTENEEYQFDRTLEMLESILGKPVAWMTENEREIQNLRKDLIKCYRENSGRTLHCAEMAKNYSEFIFKMQYQRILKNSESNDREETMQSASQPPPPYEHFPPYL
ncbi:uncharacterized protein LOC142229570 [Haematobia irritans]|uniref:uncharacterized protein LOC142229570 n=1 Tax=Haematobia irritans TaxID=7368 RepID=UPI003F509992